MSQAAGPLGASDREGGFTLLELAVALGLWVILLSGIVGMLWHTAQSSTRMVERQSSAEHARVAIDALVVNLQMGEEILLDTDSTGRLRLLRSYQASPVRCLAFNHENCSRLHCIGGYVRRGYEFRFNSQRQVLTYGGHNELAYLSEVKLQRDGDFIHIKVVTVPEGPDAEPITLQATVDMRHRPE